MNHLVRLAIPTLLITLGAFASFAPVHVAHAQGAVSEEQRVALLESLLDRLIDLLEQLYPQVDWDGVRGEEDEDSDADDDDQDDDDEDDNEEEDDEEDEDENEDDEPTAQAPVGGNEARANFTIPLTLEAFGSDMYVEKTATRNAAAQTGDGITYVIQDGSGTTYVGGSASASFASDDENGDTASYFKINDGDEREFVLQMTLDNAGATEGFYRAKVVGIAFDDDATAGGEETITAIFVNTKTPTVFVDDADANN